MLLDTVHLASPTSESCSTQTGDCRGTFDFVNWMLNIELQDADW